MPALAILILCCSYKTRKILHQFVILREVVTQAVLASEILAAALAVYAHLKNSISYLPYLNKHKCDVI